MRKGVKRGERGFVFRVSGPDSNGIEVRGSGLMGEFTVFFPAPCTVHFATDSEIDNLSYNYLVWNRK